VGIFQVLRIASVALVLAFIWRTTLGTYRGIQIATALLEPHDFGLYLRTKRGGGSLWSRNGFSSASFPPDPPSPLLALDGSPDAAGPTSPPPCVFVATDLRFIVVKYQS